MEQRAAIRRLDTVVLSCIAPREDAVERLSNLMEHPVTSGLEGRRFCVIRANHPKLGELVARWLTA